MNTSIVTVVPRIVTTKSLMILLFSFVASIVIVTSVSLVYGEIPYLEQVKANYDNYNDSLWNLGNNIQEGDYYSYKICNDDTMYQVIYPYHCYIISLEFVTILESYNGKVWVVQASLTTPEISQLMIFLIDSDSFDVSTDPFNKKIGESIQNTIFLLSQYGEKSLSIGTIWDYLDSYYTNKIPLEIKNKQSIQISNDSNYTSNYETLETSVLSYDIIIPSNTYLHNSFPFPLKAVTYSPNIIYPEPQELYYFELIDYSRVYRSNNAIETIDGTIVETMVEELGAEK